MKYFSRIFSGFRSLIVGFGITLKRFRKTRLGHKAVTLQYPKEKPELSPAYRGAIKLVRFDETQTHDCVACLQCQKICPSYCIKITGGKVEGIKKKRAETFTMDFALCSLCGLCIDVCPTTTLEYSKLYDEAGFQRDWNMDLLENFRAFEDQFRLQQRDREDAAAAEKKAKAEAKKKAAAEKKAKEEAANKKAAAEAEAPTEEAALSRDAAATQEAP